MLAHPVTEHVSTYREVSVKATVTDGVTILISIAPLELVEGPIETNRKAYRNPAISGLVG
jgi:hypothetical protein